MNHIEKTIFNPRYSLFIQNLVQLRKEKRLSQRQLAKLLGVAQCYVARIETKERRLDIIETIRYLHTLGLSKREIFDLMEKFF